MNTDEIMALADDFGDWAAVKDVDHPATLEVRSKLRTAIEALVADAERWRTFLNTRPSNTHEVINAAIDAARSKT